MNTEFRVYNTGDKIWLSKRHDKQTVVKIVTHDGIVWTESKPTLTYLSGIEKIIHQVDVIFTRFIFKILA